MSSSLILSNEAIAERFHDEFVENWRIVGELDDAGLAALANRLPGVTDQIRNQAEKIIASTHAAVR